MMEHSLNLILYLNTKCINKYRNIILCISSYQIGIRIKIGKHDFQVNTINRKLFLRFWYKKDGNQWARRHNNKIRKNVNFYLKKNLKQIFIVSTSPGAQLAVGFNQTVGEEAPFLSHLLVILLVSLPCLNWPE